MENTHKAITASFRLVDVTDGETLIQEFPAENPLQFFTALSMMPLDIIETTMAATPVGGDYSLTLSPEEAFGPVLANRIFDLPKSVFGADFNSLGIAVDAMLPLRSEDGQVFVARVVAIADDAVTVDINHPLAGRTLHVSGTIISSHEASQEEIDAFLKSQHGCGGCGGGCGNCGGDCGGGCGGDCNCGSCGE